jgi:error-prone DNA polymerase
MAEYVELHCHSCFSFREGASTPLELVLQARSLGYPALALTDHDGLAGAMEFALTANEWGVKPIIGAELTIREHLLPTRPPSSVWESGGTPPRPPGNGAPPLCTPPVHLTLLAESPRGYANLSRLISMAHLESPRDDPALDPAALAGHSEGIIALSGCRNGELSRLVAAYDMPGARRAAERHTALFGRESFFIELQDNLVYGDRRRNQGLVALAREMDLGVVATNNVHYHVRARHRLQDVMVAIQHRTTLDASEHLRRKNAEFYLKSPEEMSALFAELPEALRNTVAIAERCAPDPHPKVEDSPRRDQRIAPLPLAGEGTGVREQGFDLTRDLTYVFPDYESSDGRSADETLEEICFAAARDLYG